MAVEGAKKIAVYIGDGYEEPIVSIKANPVNPDYIDVVATDPMGFQRTHIIFRENVEVLIGGKDKAPTTGQG